MIPIREFQGKDGGVLEAVGAGDISPHCAIVERNEPRKPRRELEVVGFDGRPH